MLILCAKFYGNLLATLKVTVVKYFSFFCDMVQIMRPELMLSDLAFPPPAPRISTSEMLVSFTAVVIVLLFAAATTVYLMYNTLKDACKCHAMPVSRLVHFHM